MKKWLLLGMALMLLACTALAEEHVCDPSGLIDMTLTERWEVCSCGEKLNVTTHEWVTDEWGDQTCLNCGAAQYIWDDGMIELQGYDEHDNCIRQLCWSAEGELLQDSATIFQYDGDGNVNYAWYYQSGRLFSESEYAPDAEGYMQEVRAIEYYEDGSMSVGEFNEYGDQTLIAYYYDGVLESALEYEYTYGENGFVTQKRTFSDGALVELADYVLLLGDEDDYYDYMNYVAKLTAWYEDGSSVIYLHDENGEITSETCYDAAGSITRSVTYDSEYDAEGNLLKVTTSEDGAVVLVAEYVLDEFGWTYCAKETHYAPDGTTTVILYDEFGEVIE